MSDTIGTYLWKGSDTHTINEVRKYWTDNVNTTQFWTGDPRKIGTPEFFDTVSAFIKKNYEHRYRLIEKVAAKHHGGRILEIGCGAGWELLHWVRNGMQATGLDLSASALELAKKNFEHNKLKADFKHGSAEKLPFSDASFAVVASLGVPHQTESTERAVAEVHRVLRPGGKAFIGGGAGSGYPKWAVEKLIQERKTQMQGEDAEKWKRFVELRHPEQMKKWAEEAGLSEYEVMGKGAISADDDKGRVHSC